MTLLLLYDAADGRIVGCWQSNPATLLPAQMEESGATALYALTDTELTPTEIVSDYYWKDGALVAKQVLTITADPNPFQANGVSICQISVSPFVACTLNVNGTMQSLTEGDQVLELTSDSPQTFAVSVEPMGPSKADGLAIEAQ
jgi:hypothetical protein